MKKNLLFIALAFIGFLSSCVKDRDQFIPDAGINYKSNILGIVTNEANKPVEGAVVTFNGVTKITDKNGVYVFSKVDVSSKHSFLKIKKEGYFEASRSFNTQKPADIQLRNIMLEKDFNKSFTASSGGIVEANGYKITFPANAIMVESSGTTYTGQVKAAVKYLDPSLDPTYYQMPGSLTGINANNEIAKLFTFGMLAVELQSTSGEKLQIKSGNQAEIVVNIASAQSANAPATIPLWYFDETLGYWKEEGSAQLINNTYVGKVSHFSYWNYDGSLPSVNVSGKVVDQNGNPVICEVNFFVPGQYGGHGNTNSDGTFSGAVSKDVQLKLNILSYSPGCSNLVLYSAVVGPYSTDVVLPDITVNIISQQVFSCNGTFKDCNGNLVQNGYLKIVEPNSSYYPYFFPIVNGQASGSIITCANPVNAVVSAIDIDALKESDPINLTGPGPHNLGEVSVCASEPDHITIFCSNLGINELYTTFDFQDSLSEKLLYINYIPGNKLEGFSLAYNDGNTTWHTYSTGTFTPSYVVCYFINPTQGYFYDSGTITISKGGTVGDTLEGTYDLYLKLQGATNIEHFTGEFKWKIK